MITNASMKSLRAFLVIVALVASLAVVFLVSSLTTTRTAEAWLARGPIYQYPNAGGVWKYGFWNAKVRSYYKVNRCHGSTVILNGSRKASIRTRGGRWSRAHMWAAQAWWHDDRYYYWLC